MWLITLVLGLVTFSGHISAFRPYKAEPTQTELNEINKVPSKRTICFKQASKGLTSSHFLTFIQTDNFTPFLLQFNNNIKVKLKDNINEHKTLKKQDKYFQTYYSSDNSEESNTDRHKG